MFFLKEKFSLSSHNTFGLNAVARYFASFDTLDDLKTLLSKCRKLGIERYRMLGGGSNTIFTGSFEGLVLKSADTSIEHQTDGLVIAGAGVEWDTFVETTIEKFSLQGLENLSAIPGSVGASPVQNVGAYGVEAGDLIEWVEYYDPLDGSLNRIVGNECCFGYRSSIFKSDLSHVIVLRVAYRLNELHNASFHIDYGDIRALIEQLGGVSIQNIRQAVKSIRSSKLPDPCILGNAGSFFKNPIISVEHFESLRLQFPDLPSFNVVGGVKIPAGWLIDRAGLKGSRSGSVGIHERQALVLVNYGGATAEDILSFAADIERQIYEKYGISLDKEVTIV